MAATAIQRIEISPLAVPMRRKVSHAASQRTVADPIIVRVELQNGVTGYGETLPRPYVTGETVASAIEALRGPLVDHALGVHPSSMSQALESIDALPFTDEAGNSFPAARAALELAMLDAYCRAFDKPIADITGWAGLAGFGTPGSRPGMRFTGVLASNTLPSMQRTLRLMWWYGLRHFKLKVAEAGDTERLQWAWSYLRRPMEAGLATLRIDANGGWTKDEAIERLADWQSIPFFGVEQPLAKGREDEVPILKDLMDVTLIHDESLVTMDDAIRLQEAGVADALNIRISKCGGLLPALKLAAFARRHNILIILGCMVGETSILSAAGLRFLEMTPGVSHVEGCFGSRLLSADVVARPLCFRYRGRPPATQSAGLGVTVEPERVAALCVNGPIRLDL
jgi:muconate cycloisomerase